MLEKYSLALITHEEGDAMPNGSGGERSQSVLR